MTPTRTTRQRKRRREVSGIQKSLIQNTVWNTFGTIVYFACQWLITAVVVWLYDGFTNAGNLALAINITNFFFCIAVYNLRPYQVTDVQSEHPDSAYVVTRIVTSLGAAMLCAVFVLVRGYPREQVLIIMCYMGFRFFEAIIDVLHGIVHKNRRLDYAGISMIARGLLTLGAFSVLGRAFGLLPAIIGMTGVTALFALLYDAPRARKLAARTKCTAEQVWDLLKRCLPLMFVVLMLTFFASYTRYALERIHGTAALGAYSTAVTPSVAVQLAASFLLAPLMNVFSERIEGGNRAGFSRVFVKSGGIIAGLTIAAVTGAILVGRWVLGLIFGADILPYTYLLPGAMAAAGLAAALTLMNIVFSAIRDIKGLFLGTLAGAAICVAAAEVFLEEYGLIGANYALIACQGAALLILCARYIWQIKRCTVFDGGHVIY